MKKTIIFLITFLSFTSFSSEVDCVKELERLLHNTKAYSISQGLLIASESTDEPIVLSLADQYTKLVGDYSPNLAKAIFKSKCL